MNKGIFDIQIIDVYFTSVRNNPSVFDTGSVAMISILKKELRNEQRLVEGEAMMCVGSNSKVDVIKHCLLPLPSRLVLNLNNCYLVLR